MSERTMTAAQQVVPPPRQVVATYGRCAGALRAGDYLADRRFPVARVAIIGEGLRLVARVTGRLTLARATLNGALLGFLFGLFSWITPLVSGWLWPSMA